MRLEEPYALRASDYMYAMEFSLWHGAVLGQTTRLPLVRSNSNDGLARAINWPGAGRGKGRTIVSRLVGMSLLFDHEHWAAAGFVRFHKRLVVHHRDGRHTNNFLASLEVKEKGQHTAAHNRER